jgi:hypothetical protein
MKEEAKSGVDGFSGNFFDRIRTLERKEVL